MSTVQEQVRATAGSLASAPTMKAIAVLPGRPDSVHLAELARPRVDDVPDGRGVLVKVLRVGVDGTDKEINAAEYGAAPDGYDFLVIGHEGFGQVEEVGPEVTELQPGDYVVATVRRPGTTIYDVIGTNDMTTDDTYFERGINLRHGYLTEYYVDDAEFIVKVPQGLKEVGVLLEPTTVVEKGIAQAYEIQRRLRVWRPRKAAVMGAGTIGLLAALALRLRGLDVTVFGLTPQAVPELRPGRSARRPLRVHARTHADRRREGARPVRPDLRGHRLLAGRLRGMQALGKNGVLVLSSVTGGDHHDRGAGRQDQSGVRARQQGDGRHRQRQPRVLRDGREGHGAGRGAVSGLARAAADPPGQGAGALPRSHRYADHRQGRDQGVLRGS